MLLAETGDTEAGLPNLGEDLNSASITLRTNLVKMIFLKLANAIPNQIGKRKTLLKMVIEDACRIMLATKN